MLKISGYCKKHNNPMPGYIIPNGYSAAGEFVSICYECAYERIDRVVLFEKFNDKPTLWLTEDVINFFLKNSDSIAWP